MSSLSNNFLSSTFRASVPPNSFLLRRRVAWLSENRTGHRVVSSFNIGIVPFERKNSSHTPEYTLVELLLRPRIDRIESFSQL
ncbi:hypothetical protein M378DRAFT_164554 [Amanita muscaria Koide BX008]|uniref:Uncharacterized protein n=1 Tax=Amanita muscaria (strain Koide BX008) TaxID=946122 RepID=A0A0C2X2S1_AMAMK|nr:hypothetical protein M378DRAFT_164554 [Amanita muscaria Koide BX008]